MLIRFQHRQSFKHFVISLIGRFVINEAVLNNMAAVKSI